MDVITEMFAYANGGSTSPSLPLLFVAISLAGAAAAAFLKDVSV